MTGQKENVWADLAQQKKVYKMRRILALDQASVTTGYSIFYENELKTYGHFSYDNTNIGERLKNVRQKVQELIEQYNITEVILEDIQLQNNVQTFKVLAQVLGVLEELCSEMDIKYQTVLATVWRAKIGIKGRERPTQKREAQKYVENTYHIKATQDEADSICIGTYSFQNADLDWSN